MGTLGRESPDIPNTGVAIFLSSHLRFGRDSCDGSSWSQKSGNARFWSPKSGKSGRAKMLSRKSGHKYATSIRVEHLEDIVLFLLLMPLNPLKHSDTSYVKIPSNNHIYLQSIMAKKKNKKLITSSVALKLSSEKTEPFLID